MYAWLFRSLPGPLWVRIGITLVLLAAVFLLLMEVVFPWANQFNPLNESTMDLEAAAVGTEPTGPGQEQ
ncbi:hypothetical protein [Nesterenkonia aerolata]|uniref:DUF4175 domain-containing protein n=1 Tax=Nesterenkonia aerolata TaxID=3074079 RepID=A0ABU2DUB0_9MICC|nr:hypothetical protein [Nesterenkonia sp. LY-0111]MDR8020089.1 hypothetical protein [Nesterenkonia sp. LY-0111]